MQLPNLPKHVTLIAATKTQSAEKILQAIDLGIADIGENYVQEAEKKYKIIAKKVRWHLIGHLQRNKVKKALQFFDVIQSLDSMRLAYEIDKQAEKISKIIPVFIEINYAKEETKAGIDYGYTFDFIKELDQLKNIKVEGLMTMSPSSYFKDMQGLFKKTNLKYLSMGMSSDYQEAIKYGANMVRIGTAIFGERSYK